VLEESVTDCLAAGWELVGGVSVTTNIGNDRYGNETTFAQAITRRSVVWNPDVKEKE
jgi:hypothetical protein